MRRKLQKYRQEGGVKAASERDRGGSTQPPSQSVSSSGKRAVSTFPNPSGAGLENAQQPPLSALHSESWAAVVASSPGRGRGRGVRQAPLAIKPGVGQVSQTSSPLPGLPSAGRGRRMTALLEPPVASSTPASRRNQKSAPAASATCPQLPSAPLPGFNTFPSRPNWCEMWRCC